MSTYSTNLALELIGTGEQAGTWGNTTNTNLGTLIEQAISGYVTQAVATGTDTTLTIPNGATGVARNMYIELTGTGGTNTNLIVPSNKKLYFIYNNSTGAVTVKVSGQTGVSVAATEKKILVSNGTDIVEATSYITAINSSLTLTTLNATSANITTLSGTAVNYGSATISTGNLTFSSTGQRITGDFSNATLSNRLAFQTSTTNGNTIVGAFPNGTGTNARLQLFSASDPANASTASMEANATSSLVIINADKTGTGTYLPMTFFTGGSERMRLDTSGNLGIGTSTASFRVTNNFDAPATWGNNANNFIEMWQNSGTNALGVAMGDDSLVSLTTNNGYSLLFATSGTERMRIDSSTGNVGIGTASPGTKLDVYSSSTTSTLIRTRNDTTTVYLDANNGYSYLNTFTNHPMLFGTNNAERMRIDSSGNVGIGGTAAAAAKVNVLGTYPTSGATTRVFFADGTIPSGTTGDALGFNTSLSTQAASFTLANLHHFIAVQATIGAGSAVTNQYGFHAHSGLTGATNNYGFFSNIASGSNRWNFYAAGTAQNYFAGNTGIGVTPASTVRLDVHGGTSAAGSYTVAFRNSSATNLFYIEDHGTIFTGAAANSPYNLTTGSAANVFVDSGGALYRSTSSLRYKSDVTNATHGLADVLKLRSVTYKAKNSGDTVFGGLIAEEVHDAGLTEFVAYDNEGRPDALHYGNMVALLVKAIQELEAKVAALEAK